MILYGKVDNCMKKIWFRRDGNCKYLFDRSGMLHITIFFNILGNVRVQQGNLFKCSVDAAALTSTTRDVSAEDAGDCSASSAEPWTEKVSE